LSNLEEVDLILDTTNGIKESKKLSRISKSFGILMIAFNYFERLSNIRFAKINLHIFLALMNLNFA